MTRTTIFIKDIKSAFLLFLCVKCEQKNQQVNFVSFFSTFFTLEVFPIENIIVDDIFYEKEKDNQFSNKTSKQISNKIIFATIKIINIQYSIQFRWGSVWISNHNDLIWFRKLNMISNVRWLYMVDWHDTRSSQCQITSNVKIENKSC